jgi:hypothetical protein
VDDAAALIGGTVDVNQDSVHACPLALGDGVQFVYGVDTTGNQDPHATLDRVAALWASTGVLATHGENKVYQQGSYDHPNQGPVWNIVLTYSPPYGGEPANFDILGFSHCAPGTVENLWNSH